MSPCKREAADLLRSFEKVVSGGAPPPSSVVRWTEDADLKVSNFMGSFEIGTVFDTSSKFEGWKWFNEDPLRSEWVKFETYEAENEAAELVILPGYPTLEVSNRSDGAFETNDLYLPHPIIKGRWRYWTRKDDVVVHSTGMKTDPIFSEFIGI